MLTLINTNTMAPPIAPLGLDYIASATRLAGIDTDIVDLCLAGNPQDELHNYFSHHAPNLVGISFRNVDDCFWPSAKSFLPELIKTVNTVRTLTDAPIVLGGVGFSIFARQIVDYTHADFGIHGDGEYALCLLYNELKRDRNFQKIAGLIQRKSDGSLLVNAPDWPEKLTLPVGRDIIDNQTYFKKGGQVGLETKRGCNRNCAYCADPLSKGSRLRLRATAEVAEEAENLLKKSIDVLHLCDCEFNVPREHAVAVCEEFIRRSLGKRLRWYTYMEVVPFDAELANLMAKAGCVGIDFTGDSTSPAMLKTYCKRHTADDIAKAVKLCRENNISVMIDLLLGGPGETEQTTYETIEAVKKINPDCAGASLGIRIYPGTKMEKIVFSEGPLEKNPNIHRKYTGRVDFFKPTFYISHHLGEKPAELIRNFIAGDKRFFEPTPEIIAADTKSTDHNYNDNTELVQAIKKGARGAYWHILHKLRCNT